MPKVNLYLIKENYKKVEEVREMGYQVPSYEEFMKTYENNGSLNYDDLDGEAKGYEPCTDGRNASECPHDKQELLDKLKEIKPERSWKGFYYYLIDNIIMVKSNEKQSILNLDTRYKENIIWLKEDKKMLYPNISNNQNNSFVDNFLNLFYYSLLSTIGGYESADEFFLFPEYDDKKDFVEMFNFNRNLWVGYKCFPAKPRMFKEQCEEVKKMFEDYKKSASSKFDIM